MLTLAILLHNYRLGQEKIQERRTWNHENEEGMNRKKHTDDETGESHKNLEEERK